MRIWRSARAPSRERGVALISVLLIFALATVIASEIMSRNYRDIRKTANLINGKQAYHYALSGEQFARQILYRDATVNTSDNLLDNWAVKFDTFDIENGSMTIDIIDLQGRFNINNLVASNGAINPLAAAQFGRLLSVLNISEDYTPALIDWLDQDNAKTARGAEDDDYLQSHYLAANSALADRSELLLLKNLGTEDFEKLKNHVVALPKKVKDKEFNTTKYNLNTLDAKLTEVLAGSGSYNSNPISQRQRQGGYDSLSQWLSGEGAALRNRQAQLATKSEFFEVVVKAIVDQRVSVIRTQLHRDAKDGRITVLKRQQGFE